ncbi:MAG: VWA domain-containing protein [Polyangiaceae bacterium]
MSDGAERLRALAARIERLSMAPAEVVRERRWVRFASPLLRWSGWRLRIQTERLRGLLSSVGDAPIDKGAASALPARLKGAIDELEANVDSAERAAVIDGIRAHGPLAGWLTRLHEVTARAALAVASPEDPASRALALSSLNDWAMTPLAVSGADGAGEGGDGGGSGWAGAGGAAAGVGGAVRGARGTAGGAASREAVGEGGTAATSPDAGAGADPGRLLDLELAAADRMLDAARAETHFLGRRRRLFEAARKLLLDAAAAMPLDPAAVNVRAQLIADEIVLCNRLEAAGVDAGVGLSYQALTALSRGERQKLYSTLAASAAVATSAGEDAVARRARAALATLDGGTGGTRSVGGDAAASAETERSARELIGEPAMNTIRDAYESARRELAFRRSGLRKASDTSTEERVRVELWGRYLHEESVLATLSAAISVDGCFEVGGTLAPVRVEEEHRRERIVSYPTQDLLLVPTSDARDLPTALIEDPRTVVLALAQGRLLARKFRRVETHRTKRTRLVSEARVYVLDGSDSMLMEGRGRTAGARARMRDAILLAELATLYRRASARGATTKVTLFYRYFTKALGEVARVESASDALHAMSEVVSTARHGGTDIQAALLASFDQIREARASDPDMARAQIVLVTDGEAAVDEAAVQAAREREGDFPIGVSVIALGEENGVLRRLVARQRARGEPAFYHFVSDADLAAIVSGHRAAGVRVHDGTEAEGSGGGAPAARRGRRRARAAAGGDVDLAELSALVEEIDALGRAGLEGRRIHGGAADRMGTADAGTLREMGLARAEGEGERALREARERDGRAVRARFEAWFPRPAERSPDAGRVAAASAGAGGAGAGAGGAGAGGAGAGGAGAGGAGAGGAGAVGRRRRGRRRGRCRRGRCRCGWRRRRRGRRRRGRRRRGRRAFGARR